MEFSHLLLYIMESLAYVQRSGRVRALCQGAALHKCFEPVTTFCVNLPALFTW